MGSIDTDDVVVRVQETDPCAPVIYLIDERTHPVGEDVLSAERSVSLVRLYVDRWADALTPWPAPGIYREERDFGGRAAATLAELAAAIATIERSASVRPRKRAIAGYSLAGLFSLWALVERPDLFDACGCLSGSVWYPGWTDYLAHAEVDLSGRYCFLSLGAKERCASRPILKGVEDAMGLTRDLLVARGACVDYVKGPGGHLSLIRERHLVGLAALSAHMGS